MHINKKATLMDQRSKIIYAQYVQFKQACMTMKRNSNLKMKFDVIKKIGGDESKRLYADW